MSEQKLIIKTNQDFAEVIQQFTGHDRRTLISAWTRAHKTENILVMRKQACLGIQVTMMWPEQFDIKTLKIIPRSLMYWLQQIKNFQSNMTLIAGSLESLARIPGANLQRENETEAPRKEDEEMTAKAKAKKPAVKGKKPTKKK